MKRLRLRRPASLRGRVVLAVLALVSVLLVALFVLVDVALGSRMRDDLRTRLTDRVKLAEQLDGALQPQQLVDQLRGDGVQVALCTTQGTASTTTPTCVSPHVTPAPPPGRGFGGPPFARPTDGQARPGAGRPGPVATTSAPIRQDGSTLYVETTLPNSGQRLLLSVDQSDVTGTIHRLILFEAIGGAIALAVAALLLGRVVGVALRPLDQMTTLARNIADGDRGKRLGVRRRDTELGRTATAFDAMLDELEAALAAAAQAQARLRQFLGDASHELRSPLAGLQSNAELLLRDEPARPARERAYVAMIRETRRASRLVDDLLTVARFDSAGTPPLALDAIDVAQVARVEADRLRTRAPQLDVVVDGAPSAPVWGDPLRLGQVLANLLDNARQACAPDGHVRVTVTRAGDTCLIDVADDGRGIADADRERVFERLVRLDDSRSRDTGGFGLGLPIARTLAEAHGGTLRCLPSAAGALFRLELPVRAEAEEHRTLLAR